MPRTWQVRCSECKKLKWPYVIVVPDPYLCALCKATSPKKREAARAAAKKSVESRRKKGRVR
jgi:hypothetical protein